MSDRGRRSEEQSAERHRVERNLEELGSRIEYPDTPDLARAVRHHLDADTEAHPVRGEWTWLPFSPRWAVAAVVLLLVVSLPLLSPGVRDTLSGVSLGGGSAGSAASGGSGGEAASGASGGSATSDGRKRDATVSGAASGASPGGDLAATGAGKEFGASLTLDQAREKLGGRLVLPPSLGEPAEVYALGGSEGEGVAVVYLRRAGLPPLGGTGAGLVLTEIPVQLRSMYSGGDPRESPGVEEVKVVGGRGYWAPGSATLSHPLDRSVHPPANVLVWEQGGLVLRLETELPKGEAVRLAESVR